MPNERVSPRPMSQRAMSLRLSQEMADDLAAVARTDDVPISEFVRAAIAEHIAARRADREFQRRLKEQMEEDRKVLERLAGEGGTGKEN
jgi:predicted DNA-binding protein